MIIEPDEMPEWAKALVSKVEELMAGMKDESERNRRRILIALNGIQGTAQAMEARLDGIDTKLEKVSKQQANMARTLVSLDHKLDKLDHMDTTLTLILQELRKRPA